VRERDHLEDLEVSGKIISRIIRSKMKIHGID
jgi:hypothetical protein